MVNVEIPELLDGEDSRTSGAFIAFQNTVGSTTFKASVLPNPEIQINARTEAQLVAELGASLVIPDGTAVSISIDTSFTLTKPFLIGAGASLEIFSPNFETVLTYDNPGENLFEQNKTNAIKALVNTNLQITSANTTEKLMDGMIGTSRFFITKTRLTDFANLGEIEFPRVDFDTIAPVDLSNSSAETSLRNSRCGTSTNSACGVMLRTASAGLTHTVTLLSSRDLDRARIR